MRLSSKRPSSQLNKAQTPGSQESLVLRLPERPSTPCPTPPPSTRPTPTTPQTERKGLITYFHNKFKKFIFPNVIRWGKSHCQHTLEPLWRSPFFSGREAITNLDSVLKSRGITLLTKVHVVTMVFPVVMYGCESWTIKKAERQRINAFELWCWRRLLKSPLDCKKIQAVHSKGDQSWVFFGRNDAKAETPVLWPPHVKS